MRRFFGEPKRNDVFWKPKYSMLLLEKKRRKIGTSLKSNHTYTSLLQMNQVLAFTHEKLKRFCLKFDNVFKIPYTFNILRECWVACCVFFHRSFDFRTYFLKKLVHSVFSGFFGRFPVFCRNRLTLVLTRENFGSQERQVKPMIEAIFLQAASMRLGVQIRFWGPTQLYERILFQHLG
jgi:hypothetical protein